MKRIYIIVTIIIWAAFTSSLAKPQSSDLIITDVTVISPERTSPLEHAYVRIHDGRIADVSRKAIDGGQRINGTGRFLVPGLIDSHVHLSEVPGMQLSQEAAFPAIAAAAHTQEPRSYLYFGFTTVINLYDRNDVVAKWNQADVRPDAYFCGGTPVANGFPMNIIPAEFRFRASKYFLYDPRQADRIPDYVNPSEHTP